MADTKKEHKRGETVIKWYRKENIRLRKELEATKAQLKRLTDIQHLKIEQDDNTLNID